jgi:membrane protease YdiL (CAAX protease family)
MSTTQMDDRSAPAGSASPFTAWMQGHPIVAFFSIAYAGTWLLDLPMVLGKDGLGLLPYSVPIAVYIILFLLSSYAGPTLAAYLVTNAIDGKAGMRKLFRRYGQWRVGVRWYLLAIFGYPIIYVVAASISLHGLPLADLRANWLTLFSIYLPALLIFPAFITWGEEPGWRGFALTRLQERYHPLVSSLILGFLHGLWHLPVFLLVSGPPALGPFDLTQFVTNIGAIMVLTIIWTWVFNNAKGSILFAVLLHASLNAAQGWIGKLIPDFPPNAGYIALGIYFVIALVLLITTRARLGYISTSTAQNAEERE